MEHRINHITNGRAGRLARLTAALALLGVALALVACGGGDGDGGTSTNSSASDAGAAAAGAEGGGTTETSDKAVKYSQCMRENGVKDFPDPVNGRLTLRAGPGTDLNPESPTFKAAEEACRSLQPAGTQAGGGGGGGDAGLKFAQCMRENGVPKFPDPETSGGKITMKLDPSSGIDPESASFKAAQAKCGSMLGGGAQGATP